MPSTIMKCNCSHAYQDKEHGKSRRVFNYADNTKEWRCTVCKTQKGAK